MKGVPIKLREGSPPHWALRALGGLALGYVFVLPLFQHLKPNQYGELTDVLVLALAALSLNLLIGFTGQISIGHSAFFGIGAYTTAILVKDHEWSPGWTLPTAAVLCFMVGVMVGVPALRLKGLYLSLVTLALAQIFIPLVKKFDSVTHGSQGLLSIKYDAPSWTGLERGRAGKSEWLYWLALGLVALGYLVCRNLVKSRVGRAMIAVRDNQTAAAVMGVNVAVVKTTVFGVSAAMCGVAGSLFALRLGQVTPEGQEFTILGSIVFLVIMVIGGAASLLGPIIGAVAYHWFDDFTRALPQKSYLPGFVHDFLNGRPNLATIVFAALLILLMFVAPFGLVGLGRRIGRKLVLVLPSPPKGVHAPPPQPAPLADELPMDSSDTALT